MATVNRAGNRNYTIFVPVYGLQLGRDVHSELRVERVLFVAAERVPRIRRRLGIRQPLSDYRERLSGAGDRLFSYAPTYACLANAREPNNKDLSAELRIVHEAFWILASSFFYWTWRRDAALSLRADVARGTLGDISLFDRGADSFHVNFRRNPPYQPNKTGRFWTQNTKRSHFFDLLRVLKGNGQLAPQWRASLRRAAILAGQSLLARHVAEAFTYDMIAIETLLARRGDKFPDALVDRLVALFGWLTEEDAREWEKIISRLYKLRCSYVHDGIAGDITGMDLFDADTLLVNLLTNLCKNVSRIRRKDDIIRLTEELRARRVLNLKPKRPGRWTYERLSLLQHTRALIEDTETWAW
jgi:hypothetical protein